MDKIEIGFPKRKLIFGFAYGLFCMMFGFFFTTSLDYLWIILGAILLSVSIYQNKNKYIKIHQDEFTIGALRKKKVLLSEITQIEKKFGDVILQTSKDKIVVSKNNIDKKDWPKLEAFYDALQSKNQLSHH